ncbi:hypothetical protein L2E82_45422 [Cichorium intybus]|uniref:Uncharacterized protein n=1 Tax=Cichorium intybus TaxID=13427 RepID=A0ACB8ZS15_CICIN|nr:hypothetical protein L2E82_45422 [Cichorium intybus]
MSDVMVRKPVDWQEKSETRGNGDVCYGTCHHALHNVGSFNSQEDSLLIPVMYFSPLFDAKSSLLNPANSLVLKVLSASPSAYSANPKSKLSSPPSFSGSSISLVSVQAGNNARIVFSGSLDLFSNKHAIFYSFVFFKSPVQKAGSSNKYAKSGNQQFATEISKWVFHERGHLKAVNVRHHRVGETDEPAIYRINDELGLYLASFKVPDVYGVFQFKVEYQRLGYTSLSLAKQTEQMRRIVNELYSIHFSIKKASQLVKEIGRQVNL